MPPARAAAPGLLDPRAASAKSDWRSSAARSASLPMGLAGAVIAGAQVTARNTATGIAKDATTDSAGFYTVPNLQAGPYEVKVTAAGFNTAVSTVTLAVGAQQTLNVPMKVGETSQTVQVTEAAPQIDLTSSTLTGQVESRTVEDLPLNGRDWTSLATLHPGVAAIEEQMGYETSARGNRGFGAELTISGQRTTTNNYRLDGLSVNDYANSGPGNVIGSALGVDAIQEFSVLTGGFSAEYGKAAGGVVNAITKSGSNSFHGDAYEFLRNSGLDARDYFTRSADLPRAEFRRNQFGASAGGPIIKDKTFWSLAVKLGAGFVTYLKAFHAMRAGFASGSFVYGLFIAKMPENCTNRTCSFSNRKA